MAAVFAFGLSPLAAAPAAQADVEDLAEPLLAALGTAVNGADLSELSATALPTDAVSAALASAASPGLLAGVEPVQELSQAWLSSPIGRHVDTVINLLATGLLGHDLIGNGSGAGFLFGDPGGGGAAVNTAVAGSGSTAGSSAGDGIDATYLVTSHWSNGFVAEYTITNTGTTPITDWQTQFDLPANESVTNMWNANLAHDGADGTEYIVSPKSYDSTIEPGQSITIGFQASQPGAYSPPTDASVDGHAVTDGGSATGDGETTGGGGSAGGGGQILTGQYQQTHIENSYAVQNNAYNIGGGSQEIETTPTGFTLVSENGSAATNGAPLAYPSIFLGCAYTLCSENSPLPEQLSSITSADSSITYTYPTSGIWDASYDIWLNPTSITNGVNQQEIMVWFNHLGPIQPVGHVVNSDDDIDGKDFTVWAGSNGQNNVTTFVANSPITSWNNFNLLNFIDSVETQGNVNNSWYLTSVQAGFEPWTGGDGLAINNFSATVNGS